MAVVYSGFYKDHSAFFLDSSDLSRWPMVYSGFVRINLDFRMVYSGFHWITLGFISITLDLMWITLDFIGLLWISHGLLWISQDYSGFHWITLGFTLVYSGFLSTLAFRV